MKALLYAFALATLAVAGARADGPMTFDTLWVHETGSPVRGNAGLVDTPQGAFVVLGTEGGDVIALDARGAVRWSDHVPARVHGWPTTVDLPAGRTVLIGDSEGTLHAYAPDGSVRWRTSLGDLASQDWGHSGSAPGAARRSFGAEATR